MFEGSIEYRNKGYMIYEEAIKMYSNLLQNTVFRDLCETKFSCNTV
jgi:hypothetical protein